MPAAVSAWQPAEATAILAVLPAITDVFPPVPAILESITDVLAPVADVLEAIPQPTIVQRVATIFGAIAAVFTPVEHVFPPVPSTFAAVANVFDPIPDHRLANRALCEQRSRAQQADDSRQGQQIQCCSGRTHNDQPPVVQVAGLVVRPGLHGETMPGLSR